MAVYAMQADGWISRSIAVVVTISELVNEDESSMLIELATKGSQLQT